MSSDHERLLPPNDPAAFESLCLALWRDIWGDSGAQKNGRTGQAQAGVDVFGQSPKGWAGVQCKQKDGLLRTSVTVAELDTEVAAARSFEPKLALFILATSGPRDAKVQKRARQLTEPGFEVQVWSWDDIWHELYQRRELLGRILPIYWPAQAALRGRRVSPTRLPLVTGKLFGRKDELAQLDEAWADSRTHVVTLVAWGGVGKTSLVAKWVANVAAREHDGADYFDWSFYSQGTREKGAASADPFIDAALRFFGDEATADSARSPWDKGARLAELMAERRTLLVLDGLEPLQHPPGPLAGQLQDQGIRSLLRGLAGRNSGLCLVTTRERVADLGSFEGSTAQQWPLEHLSIEAGVDLIQDLGVYGSRAELEKLVGDVKGHALTLNLIGRFLYAAHGGDVRKRDLVRIEEADAEIQGGHSFRVMEAYERWFATEGKPGERLLAVLRLLGLFDRPATADCLDALRQAPPIRGLTDALFQQESAWRRWLKRARPIKEATWQLSVARLQNHGLVIPEEVELSTHPLVREHFGRRLRGEAPRAWRTAHSRIFEYLKDTTEYQPSTLSGLQPLFQALFHGCEAGRQQEACEKVYRDRIERGTEEGVGFFSTRKLGAIGENLSGIASFFEKPWNRVSPALSSEARAWLLNQAAHLLQSLGRLTEAVQPLHASLEVWIKARQWYNASVVTHNLSEVRLMLGELIGAAQDAERSVVFADQTQSWDVRVNARSMLGYALYQQGAEEGALVKFQEAEEIHAKAQPQYPLLYSLQGFRYYELLLAGAERSTGYPSASDRSLEDLLDVEERVNQTIRWEIEWRLSILSFALECLVLGRVRLFRAILEGSNFEDAEAPIQLALDSLRLSGDITQVARGLLTRAWLRSAQGDADGARADLEEAQEIAEHGPMPLHLADVHLYRARLFHDRAALTECRRLVEKHGYGRRREELADLEAVADAW